MLTLFLTPNPSPQELEDVCHSVINRPKPKVEEAPEDSDQSNHNGPARPGAEAKGTQQTKSLSGEMEVD